ncbi:MAG: tetratricopeptide repeat protein [Myxococcota bacterium]
MAKKTDPNPLPHPTKEYLELAEKDGAKLVAYDPHKLKEFIAGRLTLGELQGISKESQYQMAKVGFDYMREGKLDAAQKIFDGLQALDPFDAYFHTCLGAIAQEQGDGAKADRLYSRALEINPFSPIALAQRGEVRLSAGKLTEAIDDLTKALKEDPEGKEPATRRARVLLTMIRQTFEASKADPAKATRDARKALEDANSGAHVKAPVMAAPTNKPLAKGAEAKKPEPAKAAPAKKAEPPKAAAKKPEPHKGGAKKPEPKAPEKKKK